MTLQPVIVPEVRMRTRLTRQIQVVLAMNCKTLSSLVEQFVCCPLCEVHPQCLAGHRPWKAYPGYLEELNRYQPETEWTGFRNGNDQIIIVLSMVTG